MLRGYAGSARTSKQNLAATIREMETGTGVPWVSRAPTVIA